MMQNNRPLRQTHIFKKNAFEKEAWRNQALLCGIDEVGRGCLAGPLVTAAVILPPNRESRLLKDSKIVTESERRKAYTWITRHCWYGIGIVHHRLIDKHNIYQATLIAMKRALLNALVMSPQLPSGIVIDAMPLDISDTSYGTIPVYYFPFGERKSSSIAAASIVAKVTRDAMMTRLAPLFPGYQLETHKGYATQNHRTLLGQHKSSIIHRTTFLSSIITTEEDSHEQQQRLC